MLTLSRLQPFVTLMWLYIMCEPNTAVYKNTEWQAVAAAFTFNGALFGTWASRVPAFKGEFSLDAAELGMLLLALAAGAIVSFPSAGLLSDRLGPRQVTCLTVILYGPALALVGLASWIPLLAIALFTFGAMHGAMDVGMNGWASTVEDKLRRPVMSRFHALFSLGAGMGAGLGVLAAYADISPSMHFSIAAVVLGIPTLMLLFRSKAHRGEAQRLPEPSSSEPRFAVPKGALLLVGLIACGVSLGEGAMADWSAVFLRESTHASEGTAALGYTVFSATMVATRLAGDAIVARLGSVAVVRASGTIAAIGIATVVTSSTVPMVLIGFALIGVGYAIVMPLVFSRAARDRHTPPGRAIAAVATLGYGGMLLGPVAVGFVAHMTSLSVSFTVLAVLALAVAYLAPHIRSDL